MTTIALAGNPNVGKSSVFNALTGANQHVGNWPGKTVDQAAGMLEIDGHEIAIIDLPGTYSLSAYSHEEIITRDFIVQERPDAVVAVVDATNLERNLYLVTQLMELDVPLMIALNKIDAIDKLGLKIDTFCLSTQLGGIPVIETASSQHIGIDRLKDAIVQNVAKPVKIQYSAVIEQEIDALMTQVENYPPRWLAIKLLEDDPDIQEKVDDDLRQAAEMAMARIEAITGDDAETLIADERYRFVEQVTKGAVKRPSYAGFTTSDRIDRIVTHRIWGVPIFLFMMWVVFQFTANVSAPIVDWIDSIFSGAITHWAMRLIAGLGLSGSWVESLLVDGVIAGVGGVLVFVPVLFMLYFALAVLEDTGYMARSALVMDRFMNKIGLHGKSFLPLVVGFGCNVPAIYATRILENETDRKITAFLTTFMSCGARLPVYVIFGTAFFGAASGNLVFGMYLTGIIVAVITSLIFTRIVYKNKTVQPFVIELPPYRVPNWRTVFSYIKLRVNDFLRNAGTVILAAAIVLWVTLAIPRSGDLSQFNDVEMQDSMFGAMSQAVAPIFAPAGFDTWEATGALFTGLVAKEVVVSTMSQIYVETEVDGDDLPSVGEDVAGIATGFVDMVILTGQEIVNIVPRTANIIPGVNLPEANFLGGDEEVADTQLESALRGAFTPLAAVAFNVFILLYVPCMATIGAMRQEFGNRWMAYQLVYTLAIAWVGAVFVYQVGSVLGFA